VRLLCVLRVLCVSSDQQQSGPGEMPMIRHHGVTGARAFGPTTSPVLMTAFIGNVAGMFGSVVSASLTIMGARAARRSAVASVRTA